MSKNPKLAVILGARSLVAPWLVARLAENGWQGTLISRQNQPAGLVLPPGFTWQQWDGPLPDEAVVFSCLPLWVAAAMLPKLGIGTRVVLLGSTSIETKPGSEVAAQLAEAESLIAGSPLACTILRPTMIYDSVADGNVTRLRRMIARWGFMPLPIPASGLRQPIHADDVAAAMLAAADKDKTIGLTLTITGGETLSYREMVRRIFIAAGRKPRILGLPMGLLTFAARMLHIDAGMVERINQDMVFDGSDSAQLLGVTPRGFLQDVAGE